MSHQKVAQPPSFSIKSPVRVYRMTIASIWYDEYANGMKEYEMHYKVAQKGAIRDIREHLAKRCVVHFQQTIYRKFKRWIPKERIRIAFEREQTAKEAQELISIEARRMEGVGKRSQWRAYALPSKVLTYAKHTRKHKN